MIFTILTILIMAAVAYAQYKEGVFTSFVTFVNVMIASVVACNFFEPLADAVEGMKDTFTFLDGIEDFVTLVLLFTAVLAVLRWATNNIAVTDIQYHPLLYQGGAIVCGLLTGYVLSGFFVVAMQTLPLHENFMEFQAEITTEPSYSYLHPRPNETKGNEALRRVFPPDRIWLAMMQRASYGSLGTSDRAERKGFDPNCNFQLRYERYRRFGDPATKPDGKPWDEVLPVKPSRGPG
ncbi:MAG TPA: CvpA family protein [Vicinamibacterales bacterium]|nr:CvpA family protein [Vicinamibacterales bacterium]